MLYVQFGPLNVTSTWWSSCHNSYFERASSHTDHVRIWFSAASNICCMESCALCLQWHWPKQCSSNTFCTLWHSARRRAQIFLNDFSKHIQLERRVVFLCQRPMDDAWREPQDTSRDTSRNLSANLSGLRSLTGELPAVFVQEKEMPQRPSQSDDEHVVEVTKTEILKAKRPKGSDGRKVEKLKDWMHKGNGILRAWCDFLLTWPLPWPFFYKQLEIFRYCS